MQPSTLRQAQQIAADLLANVDDEQLELPTPCKEWNVSQLVDHLVGAQNWARCAMEGVKMSDADGKAGDDRCDAFNAAAAAAADAFDQDGALDRMVDPGFGPMPARALLGLAVTDTFTHAWDLARATGQDTDLDEGLATQILEASQASIQDSFRSEAGNIFGFAQEAPEGASAADRLAAFLGRTV